MKIEEQKAAPTSDEGPVTIPKDNHGSLIEFPYNYCPMMWLPAKDNLKNIWQGQGENIHQGDNKVLQLPYPILWLPGDDKSEEPMKDKKEIDTASKSAEDWPSKLKIVPLKLLDKENPLEKPVVLEEEPKAQHTKDKVAEKKTKDKIFPAEEDVKTEHAMDRVGEKESKIKTIPVIHLDGNNGEKPSMPDMSKDVLKNSVAKEKKNDVTMQKEIGKKQPTPQKSSKLPPVCLRVDPLPKKNGSNGKGPSPSPPNLKEKVKPPEDNDRPVPTKDIKVIDVKKSSGEGGHDTDTAAAIASGQVTRCIDKQCDDKDGKDAVTDVVVQVKDSVGSHKEEKEDISVTQPQKQKIEQEEESREKVDNLYNSNKQVRKNYSPEDAALFIQSIFRGFNVRRWKPLEKLQKIAQICAKVSDVKSQIQVYEASLELDAKQKAIISETIMNLLLQLDTIQGLAPNLRDMRKSVARDLVYLQEKLDQLSDHATNKHEGTLKKDENSNPDSAFSDITSILEEKNRQADNLLSAEGMASSMETPLSQDAVALSEASDIVLKQQPNDDQNTNCEEMQALKHENPSLSFWEEQVCEELLVVKPNDEIKQSLLEDVSLKSKLELEEGNSLGEGADIKHGEVISERNDQAIGEETKVMGDAFVAHELEPADEGGQSDKCQIGSGSLTVMYSNQVDDVEVKTQIKSNESREVEAELSFCSKLTEVSSGTVESVEKEQAEVLFSVKETGEMKEFQDNNSQELAETSSEITAVEANIIASSFDGGVNCVEDSSSKVMDVVVSVAPEVADELPITSEAVACESGLIERERNSTDYSQDTPECTRHEKSMSSGFLNDEMNFKEDNEKLRQMLEKLLNAGQAQMGVIADLNERVKSLERKLSKRKKVRANQKLNKRSHSVLGNVKVPSSERVASSAV